MSSQFSRVVCGVRIILNSVQPQLMIEACGSSKTGGQQFYHTRLLIKRSWVQVLGWTDIDRYFTVKSRLNCILLEHVFTVKNLKAFQIDVNGFSNLSTIQ